MSPPFTLPPAPISPADPAAGTPAARRRAARALGDAALLGALATRDAAVWGEFDARFRPLLETYARRVRIPSELWPQCVDDVLADEAMRWSTGAPAPAHLGAYLVRAAYHALLKARRERGRRAVRYATAADVEPTTTPVRSVPSAERVVEAVCSAAALRASAGPREDDGGPAGWSGSPGDAADGISPVLAAAAAALAARLTESDRQLLVWVAEQVPRRQIAAWLDERYEATRKRVQRLIARLRGEADRYAATLPSAERHELERFLRRAGHAAPSAPSVLRSGAARAAGAPPPPGRAAPPVEDSP